MLVKALSRELFGYFIALLLVSTVAGCGGGGNSTGNTPESPIAGDTVLIEARTGSILSVTVGDTVSLDGTKSFISTNTPSFSSTNAGLSYSWSFSYIPEGSSTVLINKSTANPSFSADIAGDYIVQLVVSAKGYTSKRSVQTIVVSEVGATNPTGPFNHVGLSSNCVQCHKGDIPLDNLGNKIMGKSVTHVATSLQCQTCHTPRGFNIQVKTDHEEVFGDCSGCHNGVIAVGKSDFHTPTDAECDDCHNTISFLTLLPDGSFDHSTITRACSGCHNGTVARGKDDSHIVTTTDCGFCHTTIDFKNAFPDHTGPDVVGKACSTCHNGTDAIDSTGFHPEFSVDCAVCHEIDGFNSGSIFDHTLIGVNPFLPACSECHGANNNIGAIGKTVDHPVTSDVCSDCHNTDSFADVTNFDHGTLDPGKRCDDCHGNTTATTPDIPATGLSTNHVATNGADCKVCHTPGTFTTGIFDHSSIGSARCDSCHDDLTAKGFSDGHIPTNGADCNGCHTDTEDFANYTMDHALVDVSVCGTCHDGDTSTGKPVGHVPTKTLDCVACHYDASSYTSFVLSPFDHAAIDGNDCASCHAVGYATPKNLTHIPSDNECSLCHNDTSVGGFQNNNFRAAVHDTLTDGCEGCHVSKFFPNNSAAYKGTTHIPTSQDCSYCHVASAADFTTSTFNHNGITSNCASCHDGSANNLAVNALGEPDDSIHNTITADCSICHTIDNNFLDGTYVDHTSPDVLSVRCDNCHNGNFSFATSGPVIKGKNFATNHPVTTSDCVVCHASNPDADFLDGGVDHTSAEVLAKRCDSCHNGTDATGVSDHPTSNHIPTSDDCGSCHIAGGAFKPSTFDHVGVTNNCESCHDGSFEDSGALGKNTGHVTTTSDCNVCHNTDAFVGAKFNHDSVTASTRCDSCHNGNAAQGKEPPVGHVPTNQDCRNCHETSGFIPGTFDHSQLSSSTRCDSCHGAGYATPKSSGHLLTALDCGVCHFGFDSFAGATFDHSGVGSNTRCDSCHGVTATGKSNDHLDTSLDCRSCHDPDDGTFAGGRWVHDASTAGRCDECHSSGNGATPKPSGHITVSIQCDECHTTSAWAFRHKSPNGPKDSHGYFTMGNYPGDHSTSKIPKNRCDLCHTSGFTPSVLPINNTKFTWNEVSSLAPTCSACHQSEAKKEHGTITTVTNKYANCTTGCHEHSVSKTKW